MPATPTGAGGEKFPVSPFSLCPPSPIIGRSSVQAPPAVPEEEYMVRRRRVSVRTYTSPCGRRRSVRTRKGRRAWGILQRFHRFGREGRRRTMGERLKDKVAIVTGAGSRGPGLGNGKAAATLFAREGARVLCVDHVKERAEETVASIRAEGGVAEAYA